MPYSKSATANKAVEDFISARAVGTAEISPILQAALHTDILETLP